MLLWGLHDVQYSRRLTISRRCLPNNNLTNETRHSLTVSRARQSLLQSVFTGRQVREGIILTRRHLRPKQNRHSRTIRLSLLVTIGGVLLRVTRIRSRDICIRILFRRLVLHGFDFRTVTCLNGTTTSHTKQRARRLASLTNVMTRYVTRNGRPPFFQNRRDRRANNFRHIRHKVQFDVILFQRGNTRRLLLFYHPTRLITMRVPHYNGRPNFTLPLYGTISGTPILRYPRGSFLNRVLHPNFIPTRVTARIFRPIPRNLMRRLPRKTSSFRYIILPMEQEEPKGY